MTNCVMWCTTCGARLTVEQTDRVTCCPRCQSTGTPCDPEKDFLIEINWHELRILCIWASNWAQQMSDPDACESATDCLHGIVGRLQRQAPNETALTLSGEIQQLRVAAARGELPVTGIETNIPPEGLSLVYGPGAVGFSKRPSTAEPQNAAQEEK